MTETARDADSVVGARIVIAPGAARYPLSTGNLSHELVTAGMLGNPAEPVRVAQFTAPRAVPEIAFLMRGEPQGPLTVASILAASEAVLGVITVSGTPDSGADPARIVLGPTAVAPGQLGDLRLLGCVLRADGDVVFTAAGAAALGHPASALSWLVADLQAKGIAVEPGWLLCSGALTEPVELAPGVAVTAEFDGLGSVDVYCE